MPAFNASAHAAAQTPTDGAGAGPLSETDLEHLLAHHRRVVQPRQRALWNAYRNPPLGHQRSGPASRSLAQTAGLPARLTDGRSHREIVIENDIAWRINVMVDFLFGRPLGVRSLAGDPALAQRIQTALSAVLEASGGMAMLQEAALLGHVHGWVDVLVQALPDAGGEGQPGPGGKPAAAPTPDALLPELCAGAVRLRVLDPLFAVPVLGPDPRRPLAVLLIERAADPHSGAPGTLLTLLSQDAQRTRFAPEGDAGIGRALHTWHLPSPAWRLPVAHIQNVALPGSYAGLGEVEPLLPLQDELNTRLSDRASRVTLQSFRIYLARHVQPLPDSGLRPGMVIHADHDQAAITPFGGDAHSPSEEAHIAELREAMDKVSGVPALAAGVVNAKIGNLTSENALRITLQGLIARTARKRLTYGAGLTHALELVLAVLHERGLLLTDPSQRRIELLWPELGPLSGPTSGPRSPTT
jgi:hypothetical protein